MEQAALRQAEIDRAIESKQQTYSLREALLLAYEEELAMIRSNRSVNGDELLLVDDLRDHANFWRRAGEGIELPHARAPNGNGGAHSDDERLGG